MQYTVIINGQSYDLPKKTMKIVEDMDKVAKVDSVKGIGIRDKFKRLFDFIHNLVGEENAKEILGSDNLDEVDLSEVTLTFKQIMEAYDKPITDYQTEKTMDKFNSLPIDKIRNLAGAVNTMATMKNA
ncbi:MAG: hypothetical protein QM697_00120 [Lachnospiraceae bacterium]